MSKTLSVYGEDDKRPVLLDLYCGGGGASEGYSRAGFRVVGVDKNPQPNYPYEFIRADAIEKAKDWDFLAQFDAVHASPPCQRYSNASNCRPGLAELYPDLIAETRMHLKNFGLPYIIENVAGARRLLESPTMLCGAMFGKKTYRHRFFETTFALEPIGHPAHVVPTSRAGHWKPGTYVSVAGNAAPIKLAKEAMAINWMRRPELVEAIPPYFTEWIGRQLLAHLQEKVV